MGNNLFYISYLKVVSIILVVFGHCVCIYGAWNPHEIINNQSISPDQLSGIYGFGASFL